MNHQEKKYKCTNKSCSKKFVTKAKLERHYKSHQDKKYECGICNLKFTHQYHLKSHEDIHIGGQKQHVCPLCNKAFRRVGDMKVHLNHVCNRKRFPCYQCNATYLYKKSLKNHIEVRQRRIVLKKTHLQYRNPYHRHHN